MSSKKIDEPEGSKWEQFAKEQKEEPQKINIDEAGDPDDFLDLDEPPKRSEGLNYPSHEELEQQLNALEMQVSEYKDAAVRAKAEADNVRRRAERDVEKAHKFGSEKLLVDMLPVVDSLVRGLEAAEPQDAQAKTYRDGMVLTLDILEKTLQKHGIKVIDPAKGEPFNPELHEAMSMQPGSGAKANTVLQVLQKGYELNGRVIRAAMVMVAS
jgi:molecular chaperone GrpE